MSPPPRLIFLPTCLTPFSLFVCSAGDEPEEEGDDYDSDETGELETGSDTDDKGREASAVVEKKKNK